jgi:hypothetical protein
MTGLLVVARAEFVKIWASRFPAIVLAVLPVGTWLFAVELYRVEDVTGRLPGADAFAVLPILFFAAWKTLLFQAAMLAFAAFWTTVDSQYGMIRVAACQPITRVEHLAGKWVAIGGHVALCAAAFAACLVAWTGVYSGWSGLGPGRWLALGRFATQVIAFSVAISIIGAAVASLRRSVGAGLVTAALAIIGLGLMTMLPFRVMPPGWVLMRYFSFPLGELPNPFPLLADSPFVRTREVGSSFA